MLTNLNQDLLEKTFAALTDTEKRLSAIEDKQKKIEARLHKLGSTCTELKESVGDLEDSEFRIRNVIIRNTRREVFARLHKLESQASFVKGFEKQTKSNSQKPDPMENDIWLDKQGVAWTITKVRAPFGWLANANTDETKRLLLKSIKKHYLLRKELYDVGKDNV